MNDYINYTKEGIGDDVLFLHGWGGDLNSFRAVYSRLKNITYTAVDLWGFGKSPLPDQNGLSVNDYADKLALFIKSQNYKNLTVVGHSFGGRIAVVLAAKYPQLISKLVLTDAAGLKRFKLKVFLKILRYKIKKRFSKKVDPSKFGGADYNAAKGALRATLIKTVKQDLSKYAKKIKCPTLIVWGEKDTETPLWIAKKYKRLIADSGLVIIKNAGHFCFLDDVNLYTNVLNSFLTGGK
jgi:pimeloyl-ACP methyl ester carboxylesterase